MGYDDEQKGFEIYRTGDYSRFEPLISIWDVRMLIQVMDHAGVGLQTESIRKYWARGLGREEEMKATLETSFKMIEGWRVTPEECEEISSKLSNHTCTHYWESGKIELSPENLEFIQEFAKYCGSASSVGGLRVS